MADSVARVAELNAMSTTPSPRPASSTSGRRKRKNGVSTRKITGIKRQDAPAKVPETTQERIKYYLPYVAVPNAVIVLGILATCFAVILIAGWSLTYLPGAVGQVWFAFHGVPVRIDDIELAAVPLLPAMGVVALVARRIRAATAGRVSILDLTVLLGLVAAFALVLSAIAYFMVADASSVYAVQAPPAVAAFICPLLLHLVGYCLGVRKVVWHALAKRAGIPKESVDAGAAAGRIATRLFLAAGVVYLIFLAAGYARVGELLDQYPSVGWGGALGLIVLCLAYLPNAVVGTLAVLLGGSFTYGPGEINLFDAISVPYPPLPLFGALPAEVPVWAPVLLLIPAGVLVHCFISQRLSLVGIAATATWSALIGAGVGVFSAGRAGAYGVVGAQPWMLALLLFVWVAVTGAAVLGVAALRQRAADNSGR